MPGNWGGLLANKGEPLSLPAHNFTSLSPDYVPEFWIERLRQEFSRPKLGFIVFGFVQPDTYLILVEKLDTHALNNTTKIARQHIPCIFQDKFKLC